jgi:hypothetical protein
MRKRNKLIIGVGINDADYVTRKIEKVNGKQTTIWSCPYYNKWKDMIVRCYRKKAHNTRPRYAECTVCNEWLTFSNFKAWMETQDWQGKHLDKDLLSMGNKVYSPDFCVFIKPELNIFMTDRLSCRGVYPLGVCLHKSGNKFVAQCSNQITKKQEFLGHFSCANQAHLAWKKRKHEIACQLADLQADVRVANALRTRYA